MVDEQNNAPPDVPAPDPAPAESAAPTAKLRRRTGRERLEAMAAAKAAKAAKDASALETPEQRKQRKLKQKLYLVHAAEKRILAQLAPPTQTAVARDEQWKRNRAALSDVQRSELAATEAATAELAHCMLTSIADLDAGRSPGPRENDTFWIDNIFVDALAHQKETNTLQKIVFHPSAAEFISMKSDTKI